MRDVGDAIRHQSTALGERSCRCVDYTYVGGLKLTARWGSRCDVGHPVSGVD